MSASNSTFSNGSADSQGTQAAEPFPFGVRLGIVLIAETSIMSVGAVVVLFFYVLYIALVNKRKAGPQGWYSPSPFHWYLASLFISEATTATGGIMGVRWAARASVQEGSFCKTQGILLQLGNVGVALATLAIAFHTFAVLVFRWAPDHPVRIAGFIVVGIWIICALIIGISAATHIGKTYWGDTQYWCWITEDYPVQQIALEYIFLFLAAFVNILLYVPLAAVVSGKVVVQGFKFRLASNVDDSSSFAASSPGAAPLSKYNKRVAMQMLCYPLVYTITTVPVAAARFSAFHREKVPFAVTTFADMVFSLSGFFNVILFTLTRPALIPRRGGDVLNGSGQIATRMSLHLRDSATSPYVTRPSIALGTLRSRLDVPTEGQRGWSTAAHSGGLDKRLNDNRSDLAISVVSSTDDPK